MSTVGRLERQLCRPRRTPDEGARAAVEQRMVGLGTAQCPGGFGRRSAVAEPVPSISAVARVQAQTRWAICSKIGEAVSAVNGPVVKSGPIM